MSLAPISNFAAVPLTRSRQFPEQYGTDRVARILRTWERSDRVPFLQLHRSKVIALHARGALENEANVHSAIYILIHAFRLKRMMDVVVDAGHGHFFYVIIPQILYSILYTPTSADSCPYIISL